MTVQEKNDKSIFALVLGGFTIIVKWKCLLKLSGLTVSL